MLIETKFLSTEDRNSLRKMRQYHSNCVTVPKYYAPNHVMECEAALKLHNSRKVITPDLEYTCDICRKYFTHSKWLIMTHKSTEHKIPIPYDYKG